MFYRNEDYWRKLWRNLSDGDHRYKTEEFYQKEAKEKLFHLGSGNKLLDFGCGSADLLVYYHANFNELYGVDFSESMLANAKNRIDNYGITNITLINADDSEVWEKIDDQLDIVTNAGVVQYFTLEQIDRFINNASKHIRDGGKIVLFDVIDPRTHTLWELKLFVNHKVVKLRIVGRYLKLLLQRGYRHFKKLPYNHKGNAFYPGVFESLANKYMLDYERVSSMYYEYRYHVIFSKREADRE